MPKITFLRAVLIASILLALILAFDIIPDLRGGEVYHWQWPYVLPSLSRALIFIVLIMIYFIGAWWILKKSPETASSRFYSALSTRHSTLFLAFLGTVILSLAVTAMHSDDPFFESFARTASGGATGPHLVGAEIDWSSGDWLNWPVVMDEYAESARHVALSPPGLPLWYGLLNGVFDKVPGIAQPLYRILLPYQCQNFAMLDYTPSEWASAWFGILMPLWAGLTVFPLYYTARRLLDDTRARMVVLWWPLIPALIMYASSWNTLYPMLAVTAFWLLLIGFERKSGALWLIASGLLTSLLTFMNFSVVPLAGLFGFYTLIYHSQRRGKSPIFTLIRRAVIVGLWFGIGVLIPWGIYWLISGISPFAILNESLVLHLDLDRPYVPWLWMHTWEWALMTGLPFIALWLMGVWRERKISVLGLSLLLTMLILVLSGTARGETGRVWLFFAPFVLLAAAEYPPLSTKWGGGWGEGLNSAYILITLAQIALLIPLAATWHVMSADDIQRPTIPAVITTAQSANADFGEFRLIGWDATPIDDAIELRLNWQGSAPMTTPYWFAALLVDANGAPAGDYVRWQPLEYTYPTTCWMPNQTIGDTLRLPLPADAQSGDWWISLLAFSDEANPDSRLTVIFPDSTTDTQIGLGPIAVP